MLKSFLLASINEGEKRNWANDLWRRRIAKLNELGKDGPADAIRTWLRSQYASDIRERKRGAQPKSFDLIGTEFHRWVRSPHIDIGLRESDDYLRFVEQDMVFYTRQYLVLMKASQELVPRLEHVLYNAHHGFTLQYMLLLAPLRPQDTQDVILLKMRLVARYVDILISWRLWNFRSIAYSTMQYAMFLVMRDIRGLGPKALAEKLRENLSNENETFISNDRLRIHQQNRYALHRLLARITDYVQVQSGMKSRYVDYVSSSLKDRYEIEHIWADKREHHADEFDNPYIFAEYRNRIGGLLLLPKSFNASYGARPYEEKVRLYSTHDAPNLLARSLHPSGYAHSPGFQHFVQQSGLPFRPHEQFRRADLDARQELYRLIAQRIWDPDDLLREVSA
jgi:hypothetical protein